MKFVDRNQNFKIEDRVNHLGSLGTKETFRFHTNPLWKVLEILGFAVRICDLYKNTKMYVLKSELQKHYNLAEGFSKADLKKLVANVKAPVEPVEPQVHPVPAEVPAPQAVNEEEKANNLEEELGQPLEQKAEEEIIQKEDEVKEVEAPADEAVEEKDEDNAAEDFINFIGNQLKKLDPRIEDPAEKQKAFEAKLIQQQKDAEAALMKEKAAQEKQKAENIAEAVVEPEQNVEKQAEQIAEEVAEEVASSDEETEEELVQDNERNAELVEQQPLEDVAEEEAAAEPEQKGLEEQPKEEAAAEQEKDAGLSLEEAVIALEDFVASTSQAPQAEETVNHQDFRARDLPEIVDELEELLSDESGDQKVAMIPSASSDKSSSGSESDEKFPEDVRNTSPSKRKTPSQLNRAAKRAAARNNKN